MSNSTALEPKSQPVPSLTDLADQINAEHRAAEAAVRSGLEHALEAGRLLLEAKAQIAHGAWGRWLKDNFDGSDRTARAYMLVAERWPKLGDNGNGVADLTLRDALKLFVRPRIEHDPADTPALPTGKYRVLYADPPWKYSNAHTPGQAHAVAEFYPVMPTEEICALPVKDLAEDNAVLFLWSTAPMLSDALQVIGAWGFAYKTCMVWDKVKHNFGHYCSVRHELLLIATRGSCTPDSKQLVDSVQVIERTEKHSEKPEAFRDIIDALHVRGEKIELFQRILRHGWAGWGNEVGGDTA